MRSGKLTKIFIAFLIMTLCMTNVPVISATEFTSGTEEYAEAVSGEGDSTGALFSDSSSEGDIDEEVSIELEEIQDINTTDEAETVPGEITETEVEESGAEASEIEASEIEAGYGELFTDRAEESAETAEVPIDNQDDVPAGTEQEIAFVNPLYRDVITANDLDTLTEAEKAAEAETADSDEISVFSSRAAVTRAASMAVCDTIEEAGLLIREGMKNRQSVVTYQYEMSDGEEFLTTDFIDMIDCALEHTGVSTEGDYLKYQYAGFRASINTNYVITWKFTYYTSVEQEAVMDEAVAQLLNKLKLGGKSDYEKIAAIYDYICSNVTYDYANLNDSAYTLKYSAYAALINKTSVCQGYAVLMYRLLLASGIDCRIIAGDSYGDKHSWNIVRLGNQYYNVDATWDAGFLTYKYFLKSEQNFLNHDRNEEYALADFYGQYPMGSEDYVPKDSDVTSAKQYIEQNIIYSIVNGTAVVNGYQGTADRILIPESVNGASVIGISSYAFYNCDTLQIVEFAGDAPAISGQAFYGTKVTAVYPVGNETWTESHLKNYAGTVEWVAHGANVHTWIEDSAKYVEVSCEKDGQRVWDCRFCEERKAEVYPATGHSWSDWKIKIEASYVASGMKERECSLCAEKEQSSVPKLVLEAPDVSVKELAYNKVKISWNKVTGADGYRIYRKVAGGSWVRLKTLTSSSLTYTDKTAVPGTKYYYSMRAYCQPAGTKIFSAYKYSKAVTTKTAAPTLVSATAASYNKITVTWKKVSGASGYRVYRKTEGGSWKKLKDVSASTTSYTDKTVVTGTKYFYTIRSYRSVNGSKVLGRYDTTGLSCKALTAAPTLSKAKIYSSSKTTITWKKVSGASGYRIYVKSNGKWTTLKTVNSATTSYTHTKAKGKSCTYTVRSYRLVNGKKVWGSYSKTGIKSKK